MRSNCRLVIRTAVMEGVKLVSGWYSVEAPHQSLAAGGQWTDHGLCCQQARGFWIEYQGC